MRALVLGGNAIFSLGAVQALGFVGIESDVINDWHAPRVRFSRYCRRYVRVPYGSLRTMTPEFVRWLEKYCVRHAIDVVIPADQATTLAVARLPSTSMRLFPVASPEALETLRDKWKFHNLLARLNLPSPRTTLLEPGMSAEQLDLGWPVMVKPPASEGSDGVARVDSAADLEALRARPERAGKELLVQQFIPGRDIDLSLIADHGKMIAYTIQADEGPGHRRFTLDERMVHVAREIVAATDFHGLAHFDMRIDSRDGALYVIECNPRVWGSVLYSVWVGVNFIELGCLMAMGRKLPEFKPVTGDVAQQGVAPRRLIKALLQGRLSPIGLSGASLASWRQAHADPLTQLIGNFTESKEGAWRKTRGI